MSPQSSITSVSCKSQSISGRCSTGRHTDRNKGTQRKFRRQVQKRDGQCIATGDISDLVGAHIIPLERSELIERELLFSPKNGVLLRADLEDDYDRHKWLFDSDGNVTVLFQKWPYKDRISQVKISKDPTIGPSKDLIELHNRLTLEKVQHCCPQCWKYVGLSNIEKHIQGSCERIDYLGDDDEDSY